MSVDGGPAEGRPVAGSGAAGIGPLQSPTAASEARGASATPVDQLGYLDATGELDTIIAELERGVVDVDVLEERLCRAVEIVEELDRRIRGARERVNSILPRLEMAARGAEDDPSDPG